MLVIPTQRKEHNTLNRARCKNRRQKHKLAKASYITLHTPRRGKCTVPYREFLIRPRVTVRVTVAQLSGGAASSFPGAVGTHVPKVDALGKRSYASKSATSEISRFSDFSLVITFWSSRNVCKNRPISGDAL